MLDLGGDIPAYADPTDAPPASTDDPQVIWGGMPQQPYLDTWNESDIGVTNPFGDFSNASASGGGTTIPTPQGKSWLDTVTDTFNNAAKNLAADAGPKAGTAAVDQVVSGLFGKTNPPPMNSNTNLANKALNSVATMLQQLNYGSPRAGGNVPGVGNSQQNTQRNTALILAVGALFVVFAVLLGRSF